MRLIQAFTLQLEGISCTEIGDTERTIIADTIFRSCKYTSAAGDDLNQNYIESIDVDGHINLFRQYATESALPMTIFGSYGSTARRLSRFNNMLTSESYVVKNSSIIATPRRLQSTCDISANITLVTPGSQPEDWNSLLSLVMSRLRENIASGFFDSVLHLVDSNGYGYPSYDGHWTRRLGVLSVASVSSSYGDGGVIISSFIVQNLYGNSPSGMPTGAPSSSSPTTLKSRLEDKGLYAAKTTPSVWCLFPYVLLWIIMGSLYTLYLLVTMRHERINSQELEKKVANIEKRQEEAFSRSERLKKAAAVTPIDSKKHKFLERLEQQKWEVGEVELEMHVDRVLGLDRGVFACDYHGSSAGKLWHEIGIYHQFIMCLGITHNRYLYTGRPNVYILNWNRLVRGFALICHYTLAFCVLSLLMLAQYPSDDKQCLRITDEESCHAYNKRFLGVYSYCKWTNGLHGENLRYCSFREVDAYDDRVLVLVTIFAAILCAPFSTLFEQAFKELLCDVEEPTINTLYMVESMEAIPTELFEYEEDARQETVANYYALCHSQEEFLNHDILTQRSLISRFFKRKGGISLMSEGVNCEVLDYAGKAKILSYISNKQRYAHSLIELMQEVSSYRNVLHAGSKRDCVDLLAAVNSFGAARPSRDLPGRVSIAENVKGLEGVFAVYGPTRYDKNSTDRVGGGMRTSPNHKFGMASKVPTSTPSLRDRHDRGSGRMHFNTFSRSIVPVDSSPSPHARYNLWDSPTSVISANPTHGWQGSRGYSNPGSSQKS